MDVDILCGKLEDLGFEFPQAEHCTKGDFFVCVDIYPYLVEYGSSESLFFTTWKSFMKFYLKFS